MKEKELKLLLLFTYNISLNNWNNVGILNRETALYKRLQNKNMEISFLTYGGHKDTNYSESLKNIKIYPIQSLIKSRYRFIPFLKTILLPIKLKNLFNKVDIIKTNQLQGSWITWLSKFIFRKTIIIRGGFEQFRNFLSLSQMQKKNNLISYLLKYLKLYILEWISYKIADAIIITSDSDIEFIVKTFKLRRKRSKIFHIPNYIDTNLFKPLNQIKNENHILFIGRCHPEKNLVNLFEAFKQLDKFTLNIIGGGPFENYIKKWRERYKINVKYWGVIPNQKLPEIINKHSIFILPSFYEGSPKTLLEAMSCGVACIGTNVRGINNVIKHRETGYLCNIDAQSIKRAILFLSNNKKLREKISTKARDYIINNYSLEAIVEKEYSIYKKLLDS